MDFDTWSQPMFKPSTSIISRVLINLFDFMMGGSSNRKANERKKPRFNRAFSFCSCLPAGRFQLLPILKIFKILADKFGAVAELFFDAQQLVVFSDPVGTG